MNALLTPNGSDSIANGNPRREADLATTHLFWSLQFCRASAMSLTRLQLALESGDRQRIMEAVDRVHDLDVEIERTVESLPKPTDRDPERDAIDKYLGHEKMAIAFEKFALASGISGPGLVSPSASLQREGDPPPNTRRPDPPDIQPTELGPVAMIRTYGPWAVLSAMITLVTVAIVMMAS